jgi:hypothetical protein
MGLASLAFVPNTQAEFQVWSFSNQASHRDIAEAIFRLNATNVSVYCVDPFDPENLGNWPWLHQAMHDQMFTAAGLPTSYDLTGIDWQDPEVVQNWVAAHSDDHNRISAFLGLD